MTTAAPRPPNSPLVAAGQIEHLVSDMTVTFAANVTLASLQQQLAERSQWLPIDGDPNATLGDLILRNSTGPLRLGFGAWRDVLLGAQFTNGLGELISVGGRVLKNVAGYDVTKLLVGSYGVFGTPVTFTARTWRRPTAALHVVFSKLSNHSSFVNELLPTSLRPHWAVLQNGAVHLGYVGDAENILFYQSAISTRKPAASHALSPGDEIARRHQFWPDPAAFRASIAPARLSEFVERIGAREMSSDLAFGLVVASCESDISAQQLHDAARDVGGSITFFDDHHRPREIRMQPTAYDLLVKLKRAFDPDNTLQPLPPNRP